MSPSRPRATSSLGTSSAGSGFPGVMGLLLAAEEEEDEEASCEEHRYFAVGMLFCKWLQGLR